MAHGEVLEFEEYVRTRQEALLRSARRLVPDPIDAQDLLQTALVRTYGRWDGIADKSLADAYLRRVMINTRTEWWRARKLEEVPTEQLPGRERRGRQRAARGPRPVDGRTEGAGSQAAQRRRAATLGADEHRRDSCRAGHVGRYGEEHAAPGPRPAPPGAGEPATWTPAPLSAANCGVSVSSTNGGRSGARPESQRRQQKPGGERRGDGRARRRRRCSLSPAPRAAPGSRTRARLTPTWSPRPPPRPTRAPRAVRRRPSGANPVKLIMSDPKVSERVKADLKPCARDSYPVDTSYGNLTGGPSRMWSSTS